MLKRFYRSTDKATPGITGLSPPRVHIDGSSQRAPRCRLVASGAVVGPAGWASLPIKAASCELGSERREMPGPLSVVGVGNLRRFASSTRDQSGLTAGVPRSCQRHRWVVCEEGINAEKASKCETHLKMSLAILYQ